MPKANERKNTTTASTYLSKNSLLYTMMLHIYNYIQSVSDALADFCPLLVGGSLGGGGNHYEEEEYASCNYTYPTTKELEELKKSIKLLLKNQPLLELSTGGEMKTMEQIQALPFLQQQHQHRQHSSENDTQILHCQQLESWDCGIACLQMILRWISSFQQHQHDDNDDDGTSNNDENLKNYQQRKYGRISNPLSNNEQNQREWMLRTIGTQSIWTIDLVFLLDKLRHELLFQVEDTACTKPTHFENDDYDGESSNDNDTRANRPCNEFPHNSMERRETRQNVNDTTSTTSTETLSPPPPPPPPCLDDITFLFCSRNLGVDETYQGYNYYKKSFQVDEDRVTKLFTKFLNQQQQQQQQQEGKESKGTSMTCSSLFQTSFLDLNFVLHLVSKDNCVAIVLLDNNYLVNATTCSSDGTKRRSQDQCRKSSFSGHYVILCGVSFDPNDIRLAEKNSSCGMRNSSSSRKMNDESNACGPRYCLVIKNPGSVNANDFVTPSHFEKAWRAPGTDHDIVFIALHKK